MAYTVLARKYRSRNFEEVIGQEPIATTLLNAIKAGRVHHGYLFTGTRGVGKTSMARILAKALNCLTAEAPTASPCLACDACVAIGEGQDIDVIEIDAASNTGVDNIRELRNNAAYRPARSRFKIYIIDEVHMLSTGAFNALLKTLEEPPPHVKFILATTEIQKVPATIQSRCQRFTFRHIGPDEIGKRLKAIACDEGAQADDAAVRRIARLANGSMRDALSILDQALSVAPQQLSGAILDELLPPAQDELILALFEQLAGGDAAAALELVDRLLNTGRGLDTFCNDAIEITRTLMLIRACGPDSGASDIPAAARDAYLRLSGEFELSHYVQMIAMLEELRRNVRSSGAGRALTDALVVRLTKMREWASIEQLLAGFDAAPVTPEIKKKPPLPLVPHAPAAPSGTPISAFAAAPRPSAESGADEVRRASKASAQQPAAKAAPQRARIEPEELPAAAIEALTPTLAPVAPGGSDAAARKAGAATPLLAPVSAEERRRIEESDPLVRQTLDLFEGTIVNLQKEVWPSVTEPE